MSFLWKTVPVYFPSFKVCLGIPKYGLKTEARYLWYWDRTGKNLTQFLQGLVLKLLKSVFNVAYKWVRILA